MKILVSLFTISCLSINKIFLRFWRHSKILNLTFTEHLIISDQINADIFTSKMPKSSVIPNYFCRKIRKYVYMPEIDTFRIAIGGVEMPDIVNSVSFDKIAIRLKSSNTLPATVINDTGLSNLPSLIINPSACKE